MNIQKLKKAGLIMLAIFAIVLAVTKTAYAADEVPCKLHIVTEDIKDTRVEGLLFDSCDEMLEVAAAKILEGKEAGLTISLYGDYDTLCKVHALLSGTPGLEKWVNTKQIDADIADPDVWYGIDQDAEALTLYLYRL